MALLNAPSNKTQSSEIRTNFRVVLLLVSLYTLLNFGALGVLASQPHGSHSATPSAWIHGIIVAATSLLMASFTVRMARGSARALLRLRITSAIMVVAIAIIESIPGSFPSWMKIEEGVCGVLLLTVVIMINGSKMRSALANN